MQISTESKDLKNALNLIAITPGVKGATENLILIDADMEGVVTITRLTNIGAMKVTLNAEVEDIGAETINANLLTAFVNRVEGHIEITPGDQQLTLKCDSMKAKIPTVATGLGVEPREWDVVEKPWKIEVARLFDIIEATIPAASKEDARANLKGMAIQRCNNVLYCIGVDGRRFHACKTLAPDQMNVLIPLEAVHSFHKVLAAEKRDTKVSFAIGERSVSLITPTVETHSLLYEAAPPPMEAFFAKEPDATFVCKRLLLLDTVLAAVVFSYNNQVLIKVGKHQLTISSDSDKGHSFEAVIDYETPATKTGEVLLDGTYLADMLRVIKDEQVKLSTIEGNFALGYFGDNMLSAVLGIRFKEKEPTPAVIE